MSIQIVKKGATEEEITNFANIYRKSANDLCIYKGKKIIYLDDYFSLSKNINLNNEINVVINNLEYDILYITDSVNNEDVISVIALLDAKDDNYVIVSYFCGNINTKNNKINGKSQPVYMLDYIFNKYKDRIILIEPVNSGLIQYYTNYALPSFPPIEINETMGYLIYGNLSNLKEDYFQKIFKSIRSINDLVKYLGYKNINDLYNNTYSLEDLKEKLFDRLNELNDYNGINPSKYKQLNNMINQINYYDIDDILIQSKTFIDEHKKLPSTKYNSVRGGRKYSRKTIKRIRKYTRKQ